MRLRFAIELMAQFLPRLTVASLPGEVGLIAANRMVDAIRQKPACVLGLATGRTMIGLYRELSRLLHSSGADVSRLRTFNLDEYIGLGRDSPYSFRRFMEDRVFAPVGLLADQCRFPDVWHHDPNTACREYEGAIKDAGGIDLQLLGVGTNGHIAFNECGSCFSSRTRVVELAEETRRNNAADFPCSVEVPKQAMTMGITTILEAKEILLLAIGPTKAKAVAQALQGPISQECPATALRYHPKVTVICDQQAAVQLA